MTEKSANQSFRMSRGRFQDKAHLTNHCHPNSYIISYLGHMMIVRCDVLDVQYSSFIMQFWIILVSNLQPNILKTYDPKSPDLSNPAQCLVFLVLV